MCSAVNKACYEHPIGQNQKNETSRTCGRLFQFHRSINLEHKYQKPFTAHFLPRFEGFLWSFMVKWRQIASQTLENFSHQRNVFFVLWGFPFWLVWLLHTLSPYAAAVMISLCYFLPRMCHVTQSFVTQTSWSSAGFKQSKIKSLLMFGVPKGQGAVAGALKFFLLSLEPHHFIAWSPNIILL